jgi:hypothetical protein
MDIYAPTDDLVVQLRADGVNHWADAMNEEVESQRLRGLLWYGDRLVTSATGAHSLVGTVTASERPLHPGCAARSRRVVHRSGTEEVGRLVAVVPERASTNQA